MTTDSNHQKIANALLAARTASEKLDEYPGDQPGTMTDGYAIQDIGIALDGRTIGGWKVGRVGDDLIPQFGTNRLVGPIFANVIADGTSGAGPEMEVYADGFAAAEAELLLRICCEPAADLNLDNAADCIDQIRVGIEIASSPFPGINESGPAVTVSDFGNNKGLVLGPIIESWKGLDLRAIEASLRIDSAVVGTADMTQMLDGPLGSVVFLVRNLRERNIPITPGWWVSAGAITGVHEIGVGQTAHASFGEFGEVRCGIVAKGGDQAVRKIGRAK